MKPLCHVYKEIASVENLFRAADATLAQGRRFRGEGSRFKFDLEREIFKLHEQLAVGRYRHGKYRLFTVWDPKVRVIAAATVRDRVVHHAAHDVVAPRLDRMFIFDSYACRMGKGTHRALDRAHSFLRANRYGLHLDVKSYFATIDHEILKGLLRRYVADEQALALLVGIVDSTAYLAKSGGLGASVTSMVPESGVQLEMALGFDAAAEPARGGRIRGLPLGNLTSQFFANLYLNELDQYVKHALKVRYYVRYMDDMLLFALEKEPLREWEQSIREFVRDRLRLQLHPDGGPTPVGRGIGFLGFRLFPVCRKLKAASVTRFIRRMNAYTEAYYALRPDRAGQAELLREIGQSARSFHAHALHGDTYRMRKCLYDRFPIINQYTLPGMKGRRLANGARHEGGRFDGDAADRGEDVRDQSVAVAQSGEVPARPAVSAGGSADGQELGHSRRFGGGGVDGEGRSEGDGAQSRKSGVGAVALSTAAGTRRAVHESGFVVLLREESGGNREDAWRLAEEFGAIEACVIAADGSRSGRRCAGTPTRSVVRPVGNGGRIEMRRFGTALRPFRAAAMRLRRWPGVGTRAQDGAGFRGGNWNNAATYARMSDRNNAANVNAERNSNNGGRAVRSAPSGVGP
jgi:hypothetical protein